METHIRSVIEGLLLGGSYSFGGTVVVMATIYAMTWLVARFDSIALPKHGHLLRAEATERGLPL
ncbi:MAG: hypothetical protein ACHQ01_06325 [Candidatus Limnocylindrales bacterium]